MGARGVLLRSQCEWVTGLGQKEPEILVASQEEVSSGTSEQNISWISKRKLTMVGRGVCRSGLEQTLGARVIVIWKEGGWEAQGWPPRRSCLQWAGAKQGTKGDGHGAVPRGRWCGNCRRRTPVRRGGGEARRGKKM